MGKNLTFALALAAASVLGGSAQAGWMDGRRAPEESCKDGTCPKPWYSRLHFWTPTAVRVKARIHGPALNPYAPPCAAQQVLIAYPCQPVDPARLVAEREILR